jgi:hypothetical protein
VSNDTYLRRLRKGKGVPVECDDGRTWPSLMDCVEAICGKRDKTEHERLRRACANDTWWHGHMWEAIRECAG